MSLYVSFIKQLLCHQETISLMLIVARVMPVDCCRGGLVRHKDPGKVRGEVYLIFLYGRGDIPREQAFVAKGHNTQNMQIDYGW